MTNTGKKNRGLGRGLSALMSDVEVVNETTTSAGDRVVPIELVIPNPEQPRQSFDNEDLMDLAESIKQRGVIQPLIVRKDPKTLGSYQIVAGERRWRAAQLAKLHDVPVVVRDFDDQQVLEVAIIENIQRTDLNPLEEAKSYRQLMDKFGHTQEQVSNALGKSRSYIANLLRLLALPPQVQEMVEKGQLSAGHARAIITAENPIDLATQVVSKGLSVRQTEKLAKSAGGKPLRAPIHQKGKDADTIALEGDLSAALKMSVTLDHSDGADGGVLKIKYKTLSQLDDLCRLLTGG